VLCADWWQWKHMCLQIWMSFNSRVISKFCRLCRILNILYEGISKINIRLGG
jgi:hypothetical protein